MEAQDYDALIAACIQHGDASAGGDPQLWAETLEYLSTQPGVWWGGVLGLGGAVFDGDGSLQQHLQHLHDCKKGMWVSPAVPLSGVGFDQDGCRLQLTTRRCR